MILELVGLALSYGLSLNVLLYWTVWLACALENKMVSVERIHQFTKIPSEAPLVIPDRRPAADWPSTGTIEINNLQVSCPLVLKTGWVLNRHFCYVLSQSNLAHHMSVNSYGIDQVLQLCSRASRWKSQVARKSASWAEQAVVRITGRSSCTIRLVSNNFASRIVWIVVFLEEFEHNCYTIDEI